ncbi:hypothetical protein D3C78_1368530 [compost metagenome]
MALQRGLLEPVQRGLEVARRAFAGIEEFPQLVLRLRVAAIGDLLAGGQRLLELLGHGIQGAAAGRRDQQGVAPGFCQQGGAQQATQNQGATGAEHGGKGPPASGRASARPAKCAGPHIMK